MSLLSAQAQAQSTWGEKCAIYLDTLTGTVHIPVSFRHRLLSAFLELDSSVRNHWFDLVNNTYKYYAGATIPVPVFGATILFTVVIAGFIVAATIAAIMSSWRNPFNRSFWSRSPSYGPVSGAGAPHVSDGDYSYITRDDIMSHGHGHGHGHGQARSPAEDDGPDIIFLKHHKYKYTLEFPAYAMSDGALSVGQLRQRAAEVTRTADPERIKLLYKGKLLDEDWVQCKAEGMKQESEVLCVVSEVQPGESSEGEMMDVQRTETGFSSVREDEGGQAGGKTKKPRNRKGKNKNGKKNKPVEPTPSHPPPPQPQAHPQPQPQAQQSKPDISTSASSLPAPAPNLKNFHTPHEQVAALTTYFRSELLPPSEAYIASPPSQAKFRDFEHKKLTETIMAQVMLKADGIEPEGDPEARNARKALVREAQETMRRLDQALKA